MVLGESPLPLQSVVIPGDVKGTIWDARLAECEASALPLYYSFLQSLFHILSTSEVKSESLGEQDKCMVFIPSNLFFWGGGGG